MKMYVMKINEETFKLDKGLPVGYRTRKHKKNETDEDTYLVGSYSDDMIQKNFFVLSRTLVDKIKANELKRIDDIVIKQHKNIASLLIALPTFKREDKSAFLVFDNPKNNVLDLINYEEEPESADCPDMNISFVHCEQKEDGKWYCPFCGDEGQYTAPKEGSKFGTFVHNSNNQINVYPNNELIVAQKFLNTTAVVIPENKKIYISFYPASARKKCYVVEITNNPEQDHLGINIIPVDKTAMSKSKYQSWKDFYSSEDKLKSNKTSLVYTFEEFAQNKTLDTIHTSSDQ